MLQERRSLILQKVTEEGKVKVADLSKELNCSEVTIRNDIRDMAAEGLLQRIHGGAVSLEKKAEIRLSLTMPQAVFIWHFT